MVFQCSSNHGTFDNCWVLKLYKCWWFFRWFLHQQESKNIQSLHHYKKKLILWRLQILEVYIQLYKRLAKIQQESLQIENRWYNIILMMIVLKQIKPEWLFKSLMEAIFRYRIMFTENIYLSKYSVTASYLVNFIEFL